MNPANKKSRVAKAIMPRFRVLYGSCTVFAALCCSRPAYAYLDPGTGSIILQSILASVAVALGAIRMYWQQCKAFLHRLKRSDRADPAGSAESSDSR